MTRRLYYDDSYLSSFQAQVLSVEGRRVFLDATAFYPTSGGQPFDTGSISGVPVGDVVDESDGRVAHVVEGELAPGTVECAIDWPRRLDHMQQHTGQHILSAIFAQHFGVATVSFHLGKEVSTVDLAAASLSHERVLEAERLANEVIFGARLVTVSYHEQGEEIGLRKASDRAGTLRVVSIAGLDRSACGGTHVRNTAEVGAILVRKLDKIRGNVRLEFVCGRRAVTRARADYDTLTRAARVFSAPLDEVDSLASAQAQRLAAAEKELRSLAAEGARREGRERFAAIVPDSRGWRVEVRRSEGAMTGESRVRATAFIESGPAVWIELFAAPPGAMLAASSETGLHAGNALKPLLAAEGGRGGGGATMAQGSLPGADSLDRIEAGLREASRG